MASADFSPFVVTDGLHTLFSSADETSLGTTRFFLSIHLPHLLQLIPSSYWTLVCSATLSLTVASCDFCSSDQRFAIRLPSDSPHVNHSLSMNRTPLSLAVSFPLLGRIRDFHPLETCAARRTIKKLPARQSCRQKWYHFILLCNNQNQHIHQLLLLHNLQASFLFP